MNREILFKAKRLDNGEWVEGLPGYDIDGKITELEVYKSFCNCQTHVIDSDTICQYTGLTDKNGRKIWENDICIIEDGTLDEEDGCFICKWDDYAARYILDGNGLIADFDNVDTRYVEIIGNIFDNPDLLEVE